MKNKELSIKLEDKVLIVQGSLKEFSPGLEQNDLFYKKLKEWSSEMKNGTIKKVYIKVPNLEENLRARIAEIIFQAHLTGIPITWFSPIGKEPKLAQMIEAKTGAKLFFSYY